QAADLPPRPRQRRRAHGGHRGEGAAGMGRGPGGPRGHGGGPLVRKFLGRLVSLLVVLTLVWAVGGPMLADRWAQEADRAWTALGSPITAFPARFPSHGLNGAARQHGGGRAPL